MHITRQDNQMPSKEYHGEPPPKSPAKIPNVLIEPSRRLFQLELGEIWNYRELFYFLVWRDIKVRYKQTAIGALWAILQPFATMVVFSIIFGKFVKVPSDNLPYPVFAYAALLPWSLFSQALNRSGLSLVGESNLIRKVYFPRLMIPLAATLAPLVDFLLSFIVLIALMVWYGISPTWYGLLAFPFLLVLILITALGITLWLAPLHVRYRDVGLTIPFINQFWMYASPVIYPVSMIPKKWQMIYSLNPMVGIIESFRWALLGKENPNFIVMAISTFVVLLFLISGAVFFKKMEPSFADVI
jgi:lipopolysaccharide transport system permease protein